MDSHAHEDAQARMAKIIGRSFSFEAISGTTIVRKAVNRRHSCSILSMQDILQNESSIVIDSTP